MKQTLTKTCAMCQTECHIQVVPEDYYNWQDGMLIQNAMPYLSDGERELLISGTCEPCFEKMFDFDEDEWMLED